MNYTDTQPHARKKKILHRISPNLLKTGIQEWAVFPPESLKSTVFLESSKICGTS